MSNVGTFRVKRAFLLASIRQEPGTELAMDDPVLISELLTTGKIEPADGATAERVAKSPDPWSVPKTQPGIHSRKHGIMDPGA